MRVIYRKYLFGPMLCVLCALFLPFIFTLPSGATGTGQTFFVQCEEKYEFCQDVGNFLIKQHLAKSKKFMVGAVATGGKLENIKYRDFVFVLLSDSIEACEEKDCMLLYIEKNDLKWQVNFSSPTNGTVGHIHAGRFVKEGFYLGTGYSIKSSFGYLFYEPIDGRYRLRLIYKEE